MHVGISSVRTAAYLHATTWMEAISAGRPSSTVSPWRLRKRPFRSPPCDSKDARRVSAPRMMPYAASSCRPCRGPFLELGSSRARLSAAVEWQRDPAIRRPRGIAAASGSEPDPKPSVRTAAQHRAHVLARRRYVRRSIACAVTALLCAAPGAFAALPDGSRAPLFEAEASLGGNSYTFSLANALKKGPVVLYFYPAAFTSGCTIEAHDFAKAMPQFEALGATVIGVSHDPIAQLQRFSVSECRKKFPVASDADGKIMKEYDAVLAKHPAYANRTSYVIAPDGKILYSYTNLNPTDHVANTMTVVRRWVKEHKGA